MKLLLSGLAIALVIGGSMYAALSSRAYVVEKTDAGFSPQKLTINAGETVTFINNSQATMWPASDSHPTHARYSEFDAKYEVPPKESWSFTFTRPGVWTYHDHAHPNQQGRIIVLGGLGESAEECIQNATETIKAYCWEGEIDRILEKGGLTAVFDTFDTWNREDPVFQRNCHDVAHYIGKETYRRYKADGTTADRIETTYCGFGFYHGFMEEALRDKGNAAQAETVQYCERMRGSSNLGTNTSRHNAVGACYHGIGHAFFDSLDSTVWGDESKMAEKALGQCEHAIQSEWERTRCASGVFNSLSIASGAGTYRISYRNDAPLGLCHKFPRYWSECAIEMGVGYVRHNKYPLMQGFEFLRQIPDKKARLYAFEALINDEVRRRIGDADIALLANTCRSFPDGEEWRACMRGVALGFFQRDTKEFWEKNLIAFCDAFENYEHAEHCRSISIEFAGGYAPELITRLCAETPEDVRKKIARCS